MNDFLQTFDSLKNTWIQIVFIIYVYLSTGALFYILTLLVFKIKKVKDFRIGKDGLKATFEKPENPSIIEGVALPAVEGNE